MQEREEEKVTKEEKDGDEGAQKVVEIGNDNRNQRRRRAEALEVNNTC